MSKRVIILRGISGSGKSTFAQQLAEQGYHIVSRDQLRLELLGSLEALENYFEQGMDFNTEEYITQLEERAVAGHLIKKHKLVIDNTHTKLSYIQALVNILFETDTPVADVEVIQLEVDPEEAYKRCQQRGGKPISKSVILRQHRVISSPFNFSGFYTEDKLSWIPRVINRRGKITSGIYQPRNWFVPEFDTEQYVPNKTLPKAVIVDLDGTTAHRSVIMGERIHMRSYYDYKEVYHDEPDPLTKTVVQALDKAGVAILFVSGRKCADGEVDVRKETERYIQDKLGIKAPILYMRDPARDITENGQDLRDDLVKYNIFQKELAPRYCILGAMDDRARVSAVWADIGLKCLICADINQIGRY